MFHKLNARGYFLNVNIGFTIIEIIVSISIITILIGLSYAGYASFTQRQKLITAGQTLKNILRDVESRNFNGEVDCTVCNCTDPAVDILEGWYVDLASRQYYGRCQGFDFTRTNLSLSMEITVDTNNWLVQFIGDPPRVNTDTAICLSLSGLIDRYYRIDLSRSGDISDSGGLISSCTP